jgi:hypothetical protein
VNFRKLLAFTPIAAVVLYVVFLCALYFTQGSIICPGVKNRVDPVPPQIQDSEVLKSSTSEGNVEALFLPAIAGADAVSKPVVIFGHGNGEVIDYWITPFHGFRERGTRNRRVSSDRTQGSNSQNRRARS